MPWRASIDDPALTDFGLKRHKLLIRPSGRWPIDNSDLIRLQLGMKKFEQIGPANSVKQHRAMFDWPPFSIHAVAIPTDLKPDHARGAECVKQHLGVGRVVAEVCDNDSIRMVATIDNRERASTRASIKPLWELLGLFNSSQPRLEWAEPADDSGRSIATAPHIMRDDERPETGPNVGIIAIKHH
jgi:hypothetical protein